MSSSNNLSLNSASVAGLPSTESKAVGRDTTPMVDIEVQAGSNEASGYFKPHPNFKSAQEVIGDNKFCRSDTEMQKWLSTAVKKTANSHIQKQTYDILKLCFEPYQIFGDKEGVSKFNVRYSDQALSTYTYPLITSKTIDDLKAAVHLTAYAPLVNLLGNFYEIGLGVERNHVNALIVI